MSLEETIKQAALKPEEIQTEAGRVRQRSLKDLIELDKYLAAKQAAKTKRRGLIIQKLVPPAADE
jgi:hypothetical protein